MFWNRQKTNHDDVQARLDSLESQMKLLRVEWEEVYDKMTNALARLRKRDRDAEKGTEPAPGPPGKALLWARAKHLIGGDRVRG